MLKSVNTVRSLAIDAIEKANSGHPGICMGAAPMGYAIFNDNLKTNPKNPEWINRDRFVLSAGHGSALLYSLLHLSGFDVTIDDLKAFRQVGSKTPGHPESFETAGVDVSTGPLGQGITMAVGIAMAEKFLSEKLNKPNYDIIDHYTYVLCGDGDLMEGISYEAASLAGHLGLEKLIVLYDSNNISLDGELSLSFSEDVKKRFEAQNFEVIIVEDGEDLVAINAAINQAKQSNKPTLIEVKTVIGYGSDKKAGTSAAHGAPLGDVELSYAKNSYDMPQEPFYVETSVYEDFHSKIGVRGSNANQQWDELVNKFTKEYPNEAKLLTRLIKNEKVELDMNAYTDEVATRISSNHAINQVASQDELFLGGSADLSCSNNTIINNDNKFGIESDSGRNIFFGVREFAMGAILNGMAIHSSLSVYGSTFLVFSDYLKPAIRLASLMSLPVTYVFTHDSIAVGEDGPTHQPVEQLAMFRSLPNINVIRPCDANETQAAWKLAYESKKTPTVLALTRQNLPQISATDFATVYNNVAHGAYVIHEETDFDRVIVATGSEVELAIDVAKELFDNGIKCRVVSMPCQELFNQQTKTYQESVIPSGLETYAIECLSPFGWERYTKNSENIFGIETFGLSGNIDDVKARLKFTKADIVGKILGK
jgi:transketolase